MIASVDARHVVLVGARVDEARERTHLSAELANRVTDGQPDDPNPSSGRPVRTVVEHPSEYTVDEEIIAWRDFLVIDEWVRLQDGQDAEGPASQGSGDGTVPMDDDVRRRGSVTAAALRIALGVVIRIIDDRPPGESSVVSDRKPIAKRDPRGPSAAPSRNRWNEGHRLDGNPLAMLGPTRITCPMRSSAITCQSCPGLDLSSSSRVRTQRGWPDAKRPVAREVRLSPTARPGA